MNTQTMVHISHPASVFGEWELLNDAHRNSVKALKTSVKIAHTIRACIRVKLSFITFHPTGVSSVNIYYRL